MRRLVAAAAHEVDGDVDRLDPPATLFGQRMLQRYDRRDLQQARNRTAVQEAGPPQHLVAEGHHQQGCGAVAWLQRYAEHLGIGRQSVLRVHAIWSISMKAFAAPDHGPPRHRGPQIIDAQVQRRLGRELVALDPDRDAGRHVHQRDDRAGREDAAVDIADQPRIVGQGQFDPIVVPAVIGDTHCAAMAAEAMRHERL
ncbi:hypothetical protein WR25_04924 [Diploscapter pachys]|uniref:Uncharacterized protein n=1 Tax=Diploscapter pachys TaxID=2018661 RepID=A0A2A2K7M0_9BILA|nr:hypothetical protein WR25_04924 [Diploscapter pachys]